MAKKKADSTDDMDEEDLEALMYSDGGSEAPGEEEIIDESETIDIIEEENEEIKDYKFMKAELIGTKGNVHRIRITDADHGFLNLLSAKLLATEGVEYAAYKATSLDPPIMTVMTEGKTKLITVLKKASEAMKKETEDLRKIVTKSIK